MTWLDRWLYEKVIDAVDRRATFEARRLLREWHVPLQVERLPSGMIWVVGGYYGCSSPEGLWNGLRDLSSSSPAPRLCLSRQEFWRTAAVELWEGGQHDELRQRLSGALKRYDPVTYLIWGRLMAKEGRAITAGMYLMLSGLHEADEEHLIEKFKQSCRNMHPNQVISRVPAPCHQRSVRARFPERVFRDFAEVPCPAWWLGRMP